MNSSAEKLQLQNRPTINRTRSLIFCPLISYSCIFEEISLARKSYNSDSGEPTLKSFWQSFKCVSADKLRPRTLLNTFSRSCYGSSDTSTGTLCRRNDSRIYQAFSSAVLIKEVTVPPPCALAKISVEVDLEAFTSVKLPSPVIS